MARSKLAKLRRKADKVFSLYIRAKTKAKYGICPLCKVNPIQCCFHFIRKKAAPWLRWREDNVIGACHRCNWIEYRNPDPCRAWYIREYGVEQYLTLVAEAMPENSRNITEAMLLRIIKDYA